MNEDKNFFSQEEESPQDDRSARRGDDTQNASPKGHVYDDEDDGDTFTVPPRSARPTPEQDPCGNRSGDGQNAGQNSFRDENARGNGEGDPFSNGGNPFADGGNPSFGNGAPSYFGNRIPRTPTQGSGFALASLILGILSLTVCCCYGAGIVFGILAIIFALVQNKQTGQMSGSSLAGLICGIVGTLFSLIIIAFMVYLFSSGMYDEIYQDTYGTDSSGVQIIRLLTSL